MQETEGDGVDSSPSGAQLAGHLAHQARAGTLLLTGFPSSPPETPVTDSNSSSHVSESSSLDQSVVHTASPSVEPDDGQRADYIRQVAATSECYKFSCSIGPQCFSLHSPQHPCDFIEVCTYLDHISCSRSVCTVHLAICASSHLAICAF